jgi:hypothetical protein
MGSSFLQRQFRDIFVSEQWHIGIVRCPVREFLEPRRSFHVEWLPALPSTRFFADPFAIRRDPEFTILFEDFDYKRAKGRISSMQSIDGGRTFSEATPISGSVFDDASVHKSYPFVLEHDGEIFCVPETCEKHEIGLYRAVQFPNRWERVCALLPCVDGVDPTVFPYEGRWWMFYTTRSAGTTLSLFLAFAPSLEGPWSPHPLNPVKSDVASARPGGTPFVDGGVLYRPAQDNSVTYGGSLRIYRVQTLSPSRYEEELVRHITPDQLVSLPYSAAGGADVCHDSRGPWPEHIESTHGTSSARNPYPSGLHTLSAAGDLCVIDAKRFRFLPQRLPSTLKSKFQSIRSHLRPFPPALT